MSNTAHQRRRRGSKREISQGNGNNNNNSSSINNNNNVSPSPDSKQSRGFWTYFRRQRQLLRNDAAASAAANMNNTRWKTGGDTLLPTTFKIASPLGGRSHRKSLSSRTGVGVGSSSSSGIPAPAVHHPSHHVSSPSKGPPKIKPLHLCGNMNSFLMGGVDKRRYRRKPKGLLHRIFWSSVPRRLAVSFFFLYVAVYHLVVPVGEWLLLEGLDRYYDWNSSREDQRMGANDLLASLKRSDANDDFFKNLPSIPAARKQLHTLDIQRDIFREQGSAVGNLLPFRKVLEQIAPEWYHRFDYDTYEEYDKYVVQKYRTKHNSNSNSNSHSSSNSEKEEGLSHKSDDEADLDNAAAAAANSEKQQKPENGNKNARAADESKRKETVEATNEVVVQTIQQKKRYHKAFDNQSTPNDRRHMVVTGGIAESNVDETLLPLRSLHNMDDLGAQYSSCGDAKITPVGTTLVIQTSIDRMWILQETCKRWVNDPIVAVVFVPDESTFEEEEQDDGDTSNENSNEISDHTYPGLMKELSDVEQRLLHGDGCPNLSLVRYNGDGIESLQGRYPVNRMRNVGLDLVQTSHVLVMDVDFVPSKDLERLLKDAVRNSIGNAASKKDTNNNRNALVVPAFEKNIPKKCSGLLSKGGGATADAKACISKYLKKDSAFLPRTFDELKECVVDEKKCVVFQSVYNWDGHSTTRSNSWLQRKWYENEVDEHERISKRFRGIPCFDTPRYEPYVVIEWCPVHKNRNGDGWESHHQSQSPISPYYDERFYGYGKNKIELVSHLRRSGVHFSVLPEGFLVHNPHPESATKETWLNGRRESDLHATMDALYRTFMSELDTKYQSAHESSTKLCKPPN